MAVFVDSTVSVQQQPARARGKVRPRAPEIAFCAGYQFFYCRSPGKKGGSNLVETEPAKRLEDERDLGVRRQLRMAT